MPLLILSIAAVLAAFFTPICEAADDAGTLLPSFAIELAALLMFGAPIATAIVAVDIVAGHISGRRVWPFRQLVARAIAPLAAIGAAGATFAALPISAVAVASYAVVRVFVFPIGLRLASKQRIDRDWFVHAAGELPNYVVATGIAILIIELLTRQLWTELAIAAAPLVFLHVAYRRQLTSRTATNGAELPMCVIARDGRVTVWNDALAALTECPRRSAVGKPLVTAMPALRTTAIPQTLTQVSTDGAARTIESVALPLANGSRTMDVSVTRSSDGLALVWQDVSARAQVERDLDRLTLATAGAHDAVWEWDLRTQALYLSSQWSAIVGDASDQTTRRIEEWLDRVHVDDRALLMGTLKAASEKNHERFSCEHRLRHENGSYRWVLCSGIGGGAGRKPSRLAGSLTDITEHVAANEHLKTAGFLDALTGLRNRADFEAAVGRRIQQFRERPSDGKFAVLYLDLDRFKIVNDSLGHLVGDELLTAVARRLESCLRDGDVLARLGGDEFAVLMTSIIDGNQANSLAFRIRDVLTTPVPIAGRDVFTSASIGVAFGHADYASPDEIMRDADTAMYHAKKLGKARHEVFDADMHTRARDRLGMENDLRRAVSSQTGFEVHYQPIVLLRSGMCVGFESLVRWRRNGEMVSPGIFIPMAEELGIIDELGTWILHEACRTFADWQRRFPASGLDYITVNASGRQLTQPSFVTEVEKAVENSRLAPASVRIEITETALMDNPRDAVEVLNRLREFGVKVYLDDFGTGYSSLSHLHRLPVDVLKIDQSFVKSMLVPDRPAIVESILALANTMKTGVVAEGIEHESQAEELMRLGCTHAQGYLFSKPLPAPAAEKVIAAAMPLAAVPA